MKTRVDESERHLATHEGESGLLGAEQECPLFGCATQNAVDKGPTTEGTEPQQEVQRPRTPITPPPSSEQEGAAPCVPMLRHPPLPEEKAIALYPHLQALFVQRSLPLKPIWTLRDVAQIFDVAVRTIQDWIRDKKLAARNLPGRGRFLSEALEAF